MIARTVDQQSGNILVAIAQRARATPGATLVVMEAIGLAGGLALSAWHSPGPQLSLPFFAAGAFGMWGIIDHVLESPPRIKSWRRSGLRGFQAVVAAAGIGCAIGTAFIVAGWLIGTFIS